MNMFQTANGAATFLTLSALMAGMARGINLIQGNPVDYLHAHLEIVLLLTFLVVFRIKTWLDDHRHFGEPDQDASWLRYAGFILAIFSWIFWGLAAYLIWSTVISSEMMLTSIVISTAWIAVHVLEILFDQRKENKEILTLLTRRNWVLINMGYAFCLLLHVGILAPAIEPGAAMPLVAVLALLLFDIMTSRSFRGILGAGAPPS